MIETDPASQRSVLQSAMQIISRSEAKAAGLSRYFTGKPCARGHIGERTTSNGNCHECGRLRMGKWYAENQEEGRARSLRWLNKDRVRARTLQRQRRCEHGDQYREKHRSESRAAYARDPDRVARRNAKYRTANRAKVTARQKRWQLANPEKVRAMAARARIIHREKKLADTRNRRARLRAAHGSHTAADIASIAELQRHRCANCRTSLKRSKRHVDHIIPIALGGSNSRQNLQLLCFHCNTSKQHRHPLDFARQQGLLL